MSKTKRDVLADKIWNYLTDKERDSILHAVNTGRGLTEIEATDDTLAKKLTLEYLRYRATSD